MNYGQKVEEASFQSFLTHGINENVKAVRGEIVAADYNAVDIFLSNGGKEFKWRIFEFKHNEGFDSPKEKQEEKYLQNIKSVMSKTIGEDNYDKAVSKATDFKTFAGILCNMCADKFKDSKPFRLMLINKVGKDDKDYSVIPTWPGGFCEAMDVNPTKLKFDEAKYGSRKKDSTKVEKVDSAKGEKMPWN